MLGAFLGKVRALFCSPYNQDSIVQEAVFSPPCRDQNLDNLPNRPLYILMLRPRLPQLRDQAFSRASSSKVPGILVVLLSPSEL